MESLPVNPHLGAAVWDRVIGAGATVSPAAARVLLKLKFSAHDVQRMQKLAAAARDGTLTPEEKDEANTYEQLGCVLDILHSKARRTTTRRKAAS